MSKKVVAVLVVLVLVGGYFGLKWAYNKYHLPPVVEAFCKTLGFIETQYQAPKKIKNPVKSDMVTVEYSVAGGADGYSKAMITMTNSQGGTEQSVEVLPWSTSFRARRGSILSLVAQKQWDGPTMMTVEIKVSGKTVRTSTSNAPYGVATASMIVE